MDGSLNRVRTLLAGGKPDRMPHFDLLPNDAVLRHFRGGTEVGIGDDRAGIEAIAKATDASRWSYWSPTEPYTEILPDGRRKLWERWTVWDDPRPPLTPEAYAAEARRSLEDIRKRLRRPFVTADEERYRDELEKRGWFGPDYYYVGLGDCPQLMDSWVSFGLETFCGYLADCEEAVDEVLEANTLRACAWADGLPANDPYDMLFIGEDIAFNNAPMFSPKWLERHYFPRLKRVIDRFHARGKKILFHSDGDLNLIMDGLVGAGIDALNPIDVNAGMVLRDLHRRYPRLVFFGGIDVARLLPFGTPQEIRDTVVRAIEDTEGRILVGSSTEVGNSVPLANYLAMREAVISYRP
ncbi:MAG: uroporphyrinogen decarboxylase family protein [Candidatus Coatesbacteria bacterium]